MNLKEKDHVKILGGHYKDQVGIITSISTMQYNKNKQVYWCNVTLNDGTTHYAAPAVLEKISRAEYIARLI